MRIGRTMGLSLTLLFGARVAGAQAPKSDLCARFTAAEVGKLLGTAVEAGESAAMGTGCQWFGKDQKSYAIIQVLDTTYWIDPRQAPGYQVIEGVGKRAYSHPENRGPGEEGWLAMALTNDAASTAVLIGATATRASAVTLARQLVQRH